VIRCPLFCSTALEKVVGGLQASESGIQINQSRIMVLGLADDLDILGESLENAAKVTRPLGNEVKK